MRQYRGLTKDGKWVYGWYVERNGHATIYPLDPCQRGHYAVIPESVGQFTGRKDKNVTEIYQDHIVRKHHKNYRVVWNDKGFWELRRSGDWWLALHKIDSGKLELLGNIHQNPELMEQDNA